MKPVSYIFWDVDGTLLDFEASEVLSIRECMEKRGITVSDEQMEEYSQANRAFWKLFELGKIDRETLMWKRFQEWFERNGWPELDAKKMNEDYQTALGENPVLYPDTLDILRHFHERRVHQFVVTNGSIVAQNRKLDKSGIGVFMENIFISEKIGIQKPKKEFFDYCFSMIPGFDSQHAAIIGDSLTSDILGGSQAGIQTIWYNPKKKSNENTGISYDCQVFSLAELKTILKQSAGL